MSVYVRLNWKPATPARLLLEKPKAPVWLDEFARKKVVKKAKTISMSTRVCLWVTDFEG